MKKTLDSSPPVSAAVSSANGHFIDNKPFFVAPTAFSFRHMIWTHSRMHPCAYSKSSSTPTKPPVHADSFLRDIWTNLLVWFIFIQTRCSFECNDADRSPSSFIAVCAVDFRKISSEFMRRPHGRLSGKTHKGDVYDDSFMNFLSPSTKLTMEYRSIRTLFAFATSRHLLLCDKEKKGLISKHNRNTLSLPQRKDTQIRC